MTLKKEALEYHATGRPGKIEVVSTKPCLTQHDLSLAYTPGVAEPCRAIEANPEEVFRYTAKSNLVAVITNGTAVLGLGDIGPLAAKPVMEGKGVLFKRFADIDVFDIELNTHDPEEFIRCVTMLEPTFGGINLEDIKAPECFPIEEALCKKLSIPVFHDDQHGTAIISGAALTNALEIQEKEIGKIRIVYSGGGAAAIACAKLHISLGVRPENIIMCDSRGVIYKGRDQGMNPYKAQFAATTNCRTLAEAMKGADVFVGVSVKGVVTPEMVKGMNKRPIIFAMANPDPEINYNDAVAVRKDMIMATGRSDYPNQVNNVLGFPFIFRGALDVSASVINQEMKIAATRSLAALAKEPVPDSVKRAYGGQDLSFGPNYIIPKPFDKRVFLWESLAVAEAAVVSGVARRPYSSKEDYEAHLQRKMGRSEDVMVPFKIKVTQKIAREKTLPRIVFLEGDNPKVIQAADEAYEQKIAFPILLGKTERIKTLCDDLGVSSILGVNIVTPAKSPFSEVYAEELFRIRQRKGVTMERARRIIKDPRYFASVMLCRNDADGIVGGIGKNYPETLRPSIEIIKPREGHILAGLYMVLFKNRVLFFSDTTVNIDPTAEDLAKIAIAAADEVRFFDMEPRVAMLSFSNFGSNKHPYALKVKKATEIVKAERPDLMVDGEMQADTAVTPDILESHYPFSTLKGSANVLIFPDLQSGNIAYKLLQRLGGAEVIGPLLLGMSKPVNVLQMNADIPEIINMIAITSAMVLKKQ
ncbi:MAG: malic enzyme [Deltaproteobacteria bacterium RIFCSPLOWO2_02_FULL_50_16]|nr:MAG: malic enzyme [Deltaproteobacteria bacterium GWA2_50_8]OGQ58486.1 MAG: malic enzyme [Deltaproteobacteria bacterium RIFCSPLOWO2_02_FULL_50_16]